MMTYTETGLSLIADAVASGKQVKITRIELIADPERSEGELTHNAEIASVEKYNNTTIDIKVVTDNYNFKKDYFFNRVNVYATGADGQEVLFCFQHTKTCPIYIPAYDGRTIQNEIKIRLNVTSADVVDIVNDGVYVLRTDFEKELAKKINIADIVQDADKGEADKVISAAVAKTLQDQIDQKIDIKNIVQNTVTAATDKVVSAAVAKALQDQITELNTKNNPLNAVYIASNFDSVITARANENAFAFGHSDELSSKCGYWVIVFTMGSSGRFAQIAVGALGMSNRFYDVDNGWSKWK